MDDVLPPVLYGEIELSFELIATVPASAASMPLARVQDVVLVPGLPGVLAALDTRGFVWLIDDGVAGATPFLDLTTAGLGFTEFGPESGLRSIAFHPDFATPEADGFGKLFIVYSATIESAPDGTNIFPATGRTPSFHDVFLEVTVADPTAPVFSAGAVRELFRVEQPFGNHNAGSLRFRPDAAPGDEDYGLLYISLGDGGGGNDPLNAGEDLNQIQAKILRIDPLASGDDPYTVPATNPFVGVAGALPEIYAYGFRNPQSLTWLGDVLFAGDIGQATVEELNIVFPGGNYGWDDREGTFVNVNGTISALPEDDATLGYQYPFTQFDHEEIPTGGEAINAGVAYQGSDIPALAGMILFANFPTGEVFAADLSGLDAIIADGLVGSDETIAPERVTIIDANGEVTAFSEFTGSASGRVDLRLAQTASGEILAFSKQTGNIYRLTSAADDLLSGDEAADDIFAGVGDDTVEGFGGDDTLVGGSGADMIVGGDGNDLLIGDSPEVAAASAAAAAATPEDIAPLG